MDARAKGRMGHSYTQIFLERQGKAVYVCPHTQVSWRGGDPKTAEPIWNTSGFNDAFAVPKEDNPNKKEGGFDILAFNLYKKRHYTDFGEEYFLETCEGTFWQVKKTKANPITPKLKKLTQKCADYHNLPRRNCYIIWWPDGVGPDRGEPKIWRADEE